MNDMIQSVFDYAALPVETAITARAAAERIKLRLKRTVEDIIEIGRELTAVKDQLPHGQFLPWIAAEFEMSRETADNFMAVHQRFGDKLVNFTNLKPSILYALSAPSTPDSIIDRALEKAEAGEKVTVADVKDWKAEEARWKESVAYHKKLAESTQHELTLERQRSAEWKEQWKTERDKPKPAQIPADYETAKAKAAQLESELEKIKKEQDKLINSQVKAKLHEYQSEVDEMEQRKSMLQDQVDRMKDYLASLDGEARRIEVHQQVIEELRLKLISLAAFLSDEERVQDADTVKRWRALGDMLAEATAAVHQYAGDSKPALTVIRGDIA